ncbi:MAG: hypothetical protein WC992_05265 [Acholeplasmataceae bacterium]|jgi:hypothetical protein|nr:hypothetical protein [Acholeplasmataceae bacterium]
MNIVWFNEKPKDCIVTISAGSLTLNKPATNFFENAYSVMLGIEKNGQMIVIKPLNKAEAIKHDIPESNKYKITVRSSYSRVANKAFIDEIGQMIQVDFSQETRKYKANWQNRDQLLLVDLKEEV